MCLCLLLALFHKNMTMMSIATFFQSGTFLWWSCIVSMSDVNNPIPITLVHFLPKIHALPVKMGFWAIFKFEFEVKVSWSYSPACRCLC